MSKKTVMLLVTLITIFSTVLAACSSATPAPTEEPAPVTTEAPAPVATEAPAEPVATEAPAEPVDDTKFTIGVSNPFISSEYRTQMIAELIETNQEYMDAGVTNELVIESADTDVAGQIQQLQNLMAKGVDAILVNPGDVNGLNATLEEAVAKGILVISVDQELNVPGVYNVGIDQKLFATTSAEWLAEKLGGKGDVVTIEGFPGHPANVVRMEGVAEVFAKYPDIKVLATDTGKWDEATGQQVMSNFLAAYPNLTGYWTQDGMAIGALQAVMAANPAVWPQGVGEGRCQYLKLWQEALTMKPEFDSIAVSNHPGVSPTGLRIAVNILQGKEVDTAKLGGANGLSFVLPLVEVITSENLADGLAMCEGKPDAFLLDDILTEEEVQQYFK
ncbi:MAG TPA: substrate-binding domain-containing protein [Anaerolineales bacterium]|nr:substrate-binding domain-containing protein [Anaerolineales bacterium]